ncbi:MAG: zinc ribbon domain-containing protein [Planctomycetota bacterium]|nr:zinc ribbon domain-containing protein [Planctomycetota bacterium]
MPTYDYVCDACEHEFELFQSIKAEPETKCPECGKKKLRRLIGPGAAVIFKGSGFYQTDYRSKSYQKGAEAAKKARSESSSSDTKKDKSKSEKPAKAESK